MPRRLPRPGDAAERAVERQGDAFRRGGGARIDPHQRQVERGVARRRRQSRRRGRQAPPPGPAGPRRRAAGARCRGRAPRAVRPGAATGRAMPSDNVHAIVRHQVEAAREQAQQQVGLACAWWTDQQHAIAGAAGAAPVDLHDRALWAGTGRKGSGLVAAEGKCQRRRHDQPKRHRRRRRPDRGLCPAYAAPSPDRRGAGPGLPGDAEAGTAAARRQLQAARRVQPTAVGARCRRPA